MSPYFRSSFTNLIFFVKALGISKDLADFCDEWSDTFSEIPIWRVWASDRKDDDKFDLLNTAKMQSITVELDKKIATNQPPTISKKLEGKVCTKNLKK